MNRKVHDPTEVTQLFAIVGIFRVGIYSNLFLPLMRKWIQGLIRLPWSHRPVTTVKQVLQFLGPWPQHSHLSDCWCLPLTEYMSVISRSWAGQSQSKGCYCQLRAPGQKWVYISSLTPPPIRSGGRWQPVRRDADAWSHSHGLISRWL